MGKQNILKRINLTFLRSTIHKPVISLILSICHRYVLYCTSFGWGSSFCSMNSVKWLSTVFLSLLVCGFWFLCLWLSIYHYESILAPVIYFNFTINKSVFVYEVIGYYYKNMSFQCEEPNFDFDFDFFNQASSKPVVSLRLCVLLFATCYSWNSSFTYILIRNIIFFTIESRFYAAMFHYIPLKFIILKTFYTS